MLLFYFDWHDIRLFPFRYSIIFHYLCYFVVSRFRSYSLKKYHFTENTEMNSFYFIFFALVSFFLSLQIVVFFFPSVSILYAAYFFLDLKKISNKYNQICWCFLFFSSFQQHAKDDHQSMLFFSLFW